MAPEQQWDKVKEIFDAALDLAPAERGSYLDRVCTGNLQLRDEVSRLLHELACAGDFLSEAVAQPAFSLAPGDLVAGRYQVTRLIGRGGMGEVYEARDGLLNESIALKTLRADRSRDESVIRRFQQEIHLARKVTHPNVCRVFEVGVHEFENRGRPPLPFFTMELLTGGETLAARIRRLKRLSRAEAFPIAVQMAEGLQAAHEMGIVHADFKTGNVLLIPTAGGDRAVITDFGLARVDATMAPEETLTMSSKVVGTVAYMSPEQMTGGSITTASDIYSFGIVLFEMATGELPFDASHPIHSAVQRVSEEVVTARSLVPDMDQRWDSAIVRCLQRDPARRFSSTRDLANWFRAGAWRMPRLYWTRRDWIRASVAAVVLLLAIMAIWIQSRRPYQPRPAALDWYNKGVAALHSMTYEAARKALEQAVAADPKFALAHASLARAYEEMDYSERAKEHMLRALSAAQDTRLSTAGMRRLRVLQFVVSRDYERAVPLLRMEEDAADEREKPAAALESGWLAQQRDKTDDAAAAYERALKADPGYAAAKLRLGYLHGRRRKLDAALKAFAEAEALYSTSSDYEGVTQTLLERANVLYRSGRAADAVPVIEKALAAAHTLGSTYQQIRLQLLRGSAAGALGDTQRASDLARAAIDAADVQHMDNLASSGLVDLGNSFLRRGEVAPAEPVLRRALDLARRGRVARHEARARLVLASICELGRRPEEAKQYIDAAMPFYRQGGYRRELVQAMILRGGVHEQQGEFEEGIRLLREALAEAIQIQDNQVESLVRERLAGNLRNQGAWLEALAEYERAARLAGSGIESAVLRRNCAELYWRLGRRQEANRSLSEVEKVLQRSPNPALRFELRIQQAEMALEDDRIADATAFSRQALSDGREGGEGAEPHVKLIEALIAIRKRQATGGIELAASVLAKLETSRLMLHAASARLIIAESLVGVGERDSALKMAWAALSFYEPRRIWESVWRAHAVVARVSREPAEAEAHRTAARSALAQLKTLWPAEDVERYLARPSIALLAGEIQN